MQNPWTRNLPRHYFRADPINFLLVALSWAQKNFIDHEETRRTIATYVKRECQKARYWEFSKEFADQQKHEEFKARIAAMRNK
jgi:hypothetical protein